MAKFECDWLVAKNTWPRQFLAAVLSLAALNFGYGIAAADTFTWTGNSPNIVGIANSWGNPINWQGGLIPVNDGTADVIIPDTPRDNSDVSVPWSIALLTFQGPGNYSVNGDPLTVNDITHSGTGTATFNNSVGVSGPGAIWRAGSGPMTFNGAISGTNSVTLQAPHTITFDGSAVNTISGSVALNEGTLVLSRSSLNGAVGNFLAINGGTVRWDAPDQVGNSLSSQVAVQNNGVADLNGHNETLGQLTLINGRVQSTGGKLALVGQLALEGSAEVDLGAGELELQASVVRSGSAATASRINADLVTLNRVQSIFFVSDSPAAVELDVPADIVGAFATTFLEKSGDGTLRLAGANTYQAGTTISGGKLIVDNAAGSGTGTGTVTVKTSARLAGDGAIAGAVQMQNGAAISPSSSTGFPIGSLSIGSLSMNTASAFEVQFNQALPLAQRRDVLTVANTASIIGNLVLENFNANLLPDAATTYTILTSASLTGAFANVANGARLDAIDGSGSFVVNYGAGSAFNPNHVVLSSFLAAGRRGDFDHDGDTDGRDFLIWQRGGSPSPISASDLADWKANFGTGPVHAVPEPRAAALALLALAAATIRRRRSLA